MNNNDWELFKKTVNPLKNRRKISIQTKNKPTNVTKTEKKEDLELIELLYLKIGEI